MDDWVIWVILGAVLSVAEIFSLSAALGLLGAAAFVTAVVAAVALPLPLQLLVFTAASAAGLLLVRPAALRHMQRPQLERFGVDALIGRQATVLHEVTGHGGRVRIGGEEWTAHSYVETLVIPVGAVVDVMAISGSTALVHPRE